MVSWSSVQPSASLIGLCSGVGNLAATSATSATAAAAAAAAAATVATQVSEAAAAAVRAVNIAADYPGAKATAALATTEAARAATKDRALCTQFSDGCFCPSGSREGEPAVFVVSQMRSCLLHNCYMQLRILQPTAD